MQKIEEQTWVDLVRKYFPEATKETCDFILWEKTSFPFSPPEVIENELINLRKQRDKLAQSNHQNDLDLIEVT